MRGAVYDDNGKGINNVKVILLSKPNIAFYTGASGAYAIPVTLTTDSILLQKEGYETVKRIVYASKFAVFTMKLATANGPLAKPKLLSLISGNKNNVPSYYSQGETYSSLVENDFVNADRFPQSGFALNTDRASYSNIRRFLNQDMKVPQDAVRIEEMLNYFDLSGGTKRDSNVFTCISNVTEAPWNTKNELLFINIRAPFVKLDNVPPAHLVFLIDVSGSMDQPNRLPLLKEGFKMLVNNLRREDSIAIVVYGGNVGIYLQPISGLYKDSIKNAIENLEPGGETPGEAAIRTAYRVAENMFDKNANNRIILATDGDFNVGITSDKELEDLVMSHGRSGIYLTCLGVGMGNYKDSKLEALAKKGNGNFAYLDNTNEAEKVLVTEFTKTLYAVADDAYANIRFNRAYVKRYRLIGFDNKKDAVSDTSSELQGGEAGTGHSMMTVYEIETTELNNDSLLRSAHYDIGQLILHYKLPGKDSDILTYFPIENNFALLKDADSSLRFAAAVTMFGGLLKQSPLWKNYSWEDVIAMADSAANKNDYAQAEFLDLLEMAEKIYGSKKKKKKR